MAATMSAINRNTQKPREMATPKLGPMVRQRRLTRIMSRITMFT
jgi:hypothetical protein